MVKKITKKIDENKPPPKKRGRKPKGGKIVNNIVSNKVSNLDTKNNIILHLKHLSDSNININNKNDKSYEYLNLNSSNISYQDIQNNTNKINKNPQKNLLFEKIKQLRFKFHNNDSDKRSACFWCTYPFDNPPIYIPKNQKNNVTEVYGCFCSPECAVAYLKKEQLDTSVLWERYALLNNIYSKIYNYTSNIKPAPNPLYTLDKFYGNMNIEEYRQILNKQYLLIVVDKPLTKTMPELYDDNNDIPNIYNNLLENNKDHNPIRLGRNPSISSVKKIF
tara:strand:- start:1192 stop:2022 length:831 start_codon:yes stop_codon:yes gene_type:complete